MPSARWTTSVASSFGRIAGETPMSVPQPTYPASPPTASRKRWKTRSERRTIALVSGVG